MQQAHLGDPQVARIGLGAMGMSHGCTGAGDTESIRAVQVKAVADEVGPTSAPVALAWLLTKGGDIVPILAPSASLGSRTTSPPTPSSLPPPSWPPSPRPRAAHHTDAQMQMIER